MTNFNTPISRDLLATCWTWSGDAIPTAGGGDEVSPIDVATRIASVAKAGWAGVGFVLADLAVVEGTIGLQHLRGLLDDSGLGLVELEFLADWWETGERRVESDRARRMLFDAAETLGSTTIKASGDWSGTVEWEVFARALDELATDAWERGLRIAVEPMPMNNIRSLEAGAQLVREVNNPGAGLCIDSQHVRRGGTDYAAMASFIDIDRIFVVELADSKLNFVGDGFIDDGVNHRLYPGQGELELATFVAAMADLGWSHHWGVEIISRAHRALSVDEGVARAHRATSAVLEDAEAILRAKAHATR